jgi:hypothetical protein
MCHNQSQSNAKGPTNPLATWGCTNNNTSKMAGSKRIMLCRAALYKLRASVRGCVGAGKMLQLQACVSK